MRTLQVHTGGGVVRRHFLLAGETYAIGRKECCVLLPSGDPSISRHHADITVQPLRPQFNATNKSRSGKTHDDDEDEDGSDISTVVEFVLRDCSKHGTFVNRERLSHDTTRFVYVDDVIKFGKRVSASVCDTGMLLLLAESPSLHDADRQSLHDAAWRLGACIVRGPVPSPTTLRGQTQDVIALLYVTGDDYEMTPAVLLAMAQQYYVTTVSYVQMLVEVLRERSDLRPVEFPTPVVAQPVSLHFSVEEYTPPPIAFYDVGEFLNSNSTGRSLPLLLRQYTFLLLDAEVKGKYGALLKICGASVVLISLDNAVKFHVYIQDMYTIALVSNEMFESLETALILGKEQLINSDHNNTNGNSGNSSKRKGKQQTTVQEDEVVEAAYMALYKNGICVIPELNVQRAIFTGNASEINAKSTARCLIRREHTSYALTTEQSAAKCDTFSLNNTVQTIERGDDVDIRNKEGDCSKPLREMEKNAECQVMKSTAPFEIERTNGVGGTPGETHVDHHNENKENDTLGKEQHPSMGSSIQPSAHHASHTDRRAPDSIHVSSPMKRETPTRMDACHSLERRPVVVYAPSQVSAQGTAITTIVTSGIFPTRRRVLAHKISMYVPQTTQLPNTNISGEREHQVEHDMGASSLGLTSATSSCTASRLPSVEFVTTTHPEVLQRQQKWRRQRKTCESGATSSAVRYSSPVSSSALRRGSPAALQRSDATDPSQSNDSQKPRAASAMESRYIRHYKPAGVSSCAYQTHFTTRHPRQHSLSTAAASPTTHRHYLMGLGKVPSGHSNKMTGKQLSHEGELIAAPPSSHEQQQQRQQRNQKKQEAFSARLQLEGTPGSRGTNGVESRNPDSAEVVEYRQQDQLIAKQAADYLRMFLDIFVVDVEKSCRLLLRQGYLDAMSQKFLENGMQRVQEFLTAMQRAALDIPSIYITETTRQCVREVRKKSLTVLDRIRCTYETVRAELPAALVEPPQQRQQGRNGMASPVQLPLRRMASANNHWKS